MCSVLYWWIYVFIYSFTCLQLSKSWSQFRNAHAKQRTPSRGHCLANRKTTYAPIWHRRWTFRWLTQRIETSWQNFVTYSFVFIMMIDENVFRRMYAVFSCTLVQWYAHLQQYQDKIAVISRSCERELLN